MAPMEHNRLLSGNVAWPEIILVCITMALATSHPAQGAPNVGVASAVLPAAQSARPNEAAKVLRIGVDIVENERVTTNAKGKLQLLFLDGSALTVGPNSDVVVDRFIYDPDTKTGELVFSATKGVFRLVGGRISKTNPGTLKLPQAIIGIRGGIATINTGSRGVPATFIFGKEMTVESGGKTVSTTQPGFRITALPGKTPSTPKAVTSEGIGAEMIALESDDSQVDEGGIEVGDEDVAKTQLASLGSNEPPPTVPIQQGPPPTKTLTKINKIEGTVRREALKEETRENSGEIDGDSSQNSQTVESSGFTLSGFYGRGKRGTNTATGTLDSDATQYLALSDISITGGRFKVSTSQGSYDLLAPTGPGTFDIASGDTSPFGAVSGIGFLSDDSEFLLY